MFGVTTVLEEQMSCILCDMTSYKAIGLDNLPVRFGRIVEVLFLNHLLVLLI